MSTATDPFDSSTSATVLMIFLSLFVQPPLIAVAGLDGSVALFTTIRFERPLHFTTPHGEPVVAPAGIYDIVPQNSDALRLTGEERDPLIIHAVSALHDESIGYSVAVGLRDETSPTLTHLVLAMADGRLFYATGSEDGVMPRQVPVHLFVAGFKAFVGGKLVKDDLPIEVNTRRIGKAYRTFVLPSGMCAVLCERSDDCRAFNWRRDQKSSASGLCHLMQDHPPKETDECCLSGAKPAALGR